MANRSSRVINPLKAHDQEDRLICELDVCHLLIDKAEVNFRHMGLELNKPSMKCFCPLESCRWITDLWRLVGNEDTLAAGDGVIHVLTEVIPFHSDQVAGRGCLACANSDGTKVKALIRLVTEE